MVGEGCCEATAGADVVGDVAEATARTCDECVTAAGGADDDDDDDDDAPGGAAVVIPVGCGARVEAAEGVIPATTEGTGRDMKLNKV